MRKLTVLFALCALIPFSLAACGGDDDDDGGETTAETTTEETTEAGGDTGGGGAVAVSAAADGSLAFDQSELTAAAGSTTFEFDNPSATGHDFCIEQDGSEVGCTEVITESSDTLDAEVEAGDYTYYCSVPGHREGGMEGTLTVE
jgi:plastocyanin